LWTYVKRGEKLFVDKSNNDKAKRPDRRFRLSYVDQRLYRKRPVTASLEIT